MSLLEQYISKRDAIEPQIEKLKKKKIKYDLKILELEKIEEIGESSFSKKEKKELLEFMNGVECLEDERDQADYYLMEHRKWYHSEYDLTISSSYSGDNGHNNETRWRVKGPEIDLEGELLMGAEYDANDYQLKKLAKYLGFKYANGWQLVYMLLFSDFAD